MYKLSNYVISEEIYDNNNRVEKVVSFNTRTSTIKILDNDSYSFLKNREFLSLERNIFNALIRDKFIVNENENELQSILEENKEFIKNKKELYLVIQPTAFCPFGCHYCGQLHSPKGMSEEVQKQVIQRLRDKLSEKTYNSLRICWFGSEPLSGLHAIKNLSAEFQSICNEQSLSYSAKIVTNGWKLTLPVAHDLINNHKINHIEITLDGIEEFHDSRRHTKGGQKTFKSIYDNLLSLCQIKDEKTNVSIRCNIDERNKEGISPLIKKLAEDNLQDRISIYFAQIHSWGNDAHNLAADKKKFSEWEIDWFIEMESYGFKVNYLHSRKKQVCMTLDPMAELIDPFGGIFGCTEVSLVPSYEKENESNIHQLGTSKNEYKTKLNKNIFADFYEEEEIKKYHCHTCEIFPICGGSCPKEWKEGRIPCPSIKFNIKQRLMLQSLKELKNKEYVGFLEKTAVENN